VTPTLLCSREPQEFHAGARPADIAGKTSLGEISLGETSLGKVPLARHRMINLHVPLAAADRATREAVEAAPELDPFFIVRGCASGVEALALAVAWPPDLVPLEAPAEAHCHAMALSDQSDFRRPSPLAKESPLSTPTRARVPPRRRIW
jgi:hypothetical protein